MGATSASPMPVAAPAAIRNLLFATDFSPSSKVALTFASAIARQHHAAVFLIHVLPPEPRYELPLEHEPEELNSRKLEAVKQFDALLQSSELAGVVHEPILRCGGLWESIQSAIADRSIDLIVVGTHGREGIRKLLLGSTAEIIFRNAACPVMTVGPHVSTDLLATGMKRILFATDFSAPSMNALPYACSLAGEADAQLTLLHVVSPPPQAMEGVVMPYVETDLLDGARMRLAAMAAEYPALARVPEIVAMNGPAAEAIVGVASERRVSAIVLGVRHKPALATHSPFSVADAVVCRAESPVLTVRGD